MPIKSRIFEWQPKRLFNRYFTTWDQIPVQLTPKEAQSSRARSSKAKSSSVMESLAQLDSATASAAEAGKKKKSIEEMYQKKTHVEHILLRPEMYIGSTKMVKESQWIYNEKSKKMVYVPELQYNPGLLKLFDEILVNAADNIHRTTDSGSSVNMDTIKVDISNHEISVFNNGYGIPIIMHSTEKISIPELVFGHLLTGSNFNDKIEKQLSTNEEHTDDASLTGGRHGYGAKLTNIFSKSFKVETLDTRSSQSFVKEWKNNMSPSNAPASITTVAKKKKSSSSGQDDFTKITYTPDLARFGLDQNQGIDEGTMHMLHKRVIDLAGLVSYGPKPVKVYLNGKDISMKSFEDYCSLYLNNQKSDDDSVFFTSSGTRWNIGICPAAMLNSEELGSIISANKSNTKPSNNFGFTQISFVNAVCTSRGGTHVDGVLSQIMPTIQAQCSKKGEKAALKPSTIKNEIAIFVSCRVPSPSFDSQMKEHLVTPFENFGHTLKLTKKYIDQIARDSGISQRILEKQAQKVKQSLSKISRTNKADLYSIEKLEDANYAGVKGKAHNCTLILTEGDSAKAVAVEGLSVVGRDYFGVYPIRGKILNVRDTSLSTIGSNKEISELVKILGLSFDKTYTENIDDVAKRYEGLRYGRVMIMTDQDFDGSHIKGLIINIFHKLWPNLLDSSKSRSFLCEFITPIVKADISATSLYKNADKSKISKTISFFTLQEVENWKKDLSNADKLKVKFKYYKGLGTNTSQEAREYFRNIEKHVVEFTSSSKKASDDAIDMAFSKKRADERKTWISNSLLTTQKTTDVAPLAFTTPRSPKSSKKVTPMATAKISNVLDQHSFPKLSYDQFVNQELVHFSSYSVLRGVPSLVDGLKPSQRKILYACFLRNLTEDMKVSQLGGFCAERTGYVHAETALHATITKMAQTFVGSNNLPLLYPSGQFGTRAAGGNDAASPRYIFTRLQHYTRDIFPKIDDDLLERFVEDGENLEPVKYAPIIPMILVNGAEGIGTGWSTSIPSFNPVEIIDYLIAKLSGKKLENEEPLMPWYHGFKGSIEHDGSDKNRYVSVGIMELKAVKSKKSSSEKWALKVTELPIGLWTENFKAGLVSLVQEKTIDDFTENHTEHRVDFEVFGSKEELEKVKSDIENGNIKKLSIATVIDCSNMHLFDASGKIKKYETAESIIEDYFPFRLQLYEKRKQVEIEKLASQLMQLETKIKFVKLVVDRAIEISNRKESDILKDLQKHSFNENDIKKLIRIPLIDLSNDEIIKLQMQADQTRKELEIKKKRSPADNWKDELIKLREVVIQEQNRFSLESQSGDAKK